MFSCRCWFGVCVFVSLLVAVRFACLWVVNLGLLVTSVLGRSVVLLALCCFVWLLIVLLFYLDMVVCCCLLGFSCLL